MKDKKSVIVGILLVMSLLCGGTFVREPKQVLFLVDASGSMAYHQKMEVAESLLTLFATTVGKDCEIEILYYNDEVWKGEALPHGNTDIGFALEQAMQQVEDSTTLILLSDGETDLRGSQTGRTEEQSEASLAWACEKAKEKQCSIETVAIGNWEASVLEEIAAATGGDCMTLRGKKELQAVFSTLYEKVTGKQVIPLGQGNVFTVETEQYYEEGIQVVLYGDTNSVFAEGAEVVQGNGYCVVFSDGTVNIQTKGSVAADKLPRRNVVSHMTEMENTNAFRIPIVLKLYEKETGQEAEPQRYTNVSACVTVRNTGDYREIPLQKGKNGFYGVFQQGTEGWYTFTSTVFYGTMQQETKTVEVFLGNTPPLQVKEERLRLPLLKKTREIPLGDYFAEKDGEKLTYAIEELPEGIEGRLQGEVLQLKGTKEMEGTLSICVTDERGASIIGKIPIGVEPVWVYWKPFVLVGIGMCVICSFLLARQKKKERPPQRGRLLLEVLKVANEKDIPVYHWNLSAMPEEGISIGALFRILEVEEEVPEANQVYLIQKRNGIVLKHKTDCLLQKEGQSLGRKAVLQGGECLILLFEDGKTALQLTYEERKGGIYYGHTDRY